MTTYKDTILSDAISENYAGLFVTVNSSKKVELRRMNGGAPLSTFGSNAVFAILSGNMIQVNLANGKTVFYKLSASGNSVSGPYLR